AFGVGDRIDLDDLALGDGETHDGEGPSGHGDNDARGGVHPRGMQLCGRVGEHERLPGYGGCAMDHPGDCGAPGAPVGPQHDVAPRPLLRCPLDDPLTGYLLTAVPAATRRRHRCQLVSPAAAELACSSYIRCVITKP